MGATELRHRLSAERLRLTALRGQVRQERLGMLADSELSHVDQHQADIASDVLEQEVERSILLSLDDELHEVEFALDRLAAGKYGRCERCGRAIPAERLEAVPATRFCAADEASAEGMPGAAMRPGGWAELEGADATGYLPSDAADDAGSELGVEDLAVHWIPDGSPSGELSTAELEQALSVDDGGG